MTLTINDITDVKFNRENDTPERKQAYIDKGLARFGFLCQSYKIDETKIPTIAPYLPKRIAELCVLIAWVGDNLGSDFIAIRENFSIDVYQTKKTEYESELINLLTGFTSQTCGIVLTTEETETTTESNVCFSWVRG